MKNITIGIILILIIILIVGGGYLFLNRSRNNAPTQSVNTAMQKQPEPTAAGTSGIKSLRDLMALQVNQQCSFNDAQSGSSGTVVSANGKVRGDFQAQISGTATQSHMIEDGKYIYFWTEGQTKGYKMSMDVLDKINQGTVQQQYQSQVMDLKKQVSYHCSLGAAGSATFVVPSAISFEDYSSMLQSVTSGGTNAPTQMMQGNQSACTACNNLPAAAQTQCRAALKCQ